MRKQPFVFFVQKMSYFFKNRHRIGHFLGMLTQIQQLLKLLVHIGEVKIACNNQIAAFPIVLAKKGVTTFDAVFAKGPVAEMPHKQFTYERNMLLEVFGIVKFIGLADVYFFEIAVYFGNNIAKRLRINGTVTANIPLARFHIKLNGSNSGSVLTSVVLFLHQEVELVERVAHRTVFLTIKV